MAYRPGGDESSDDELDELVYGSDYKLAEKMNQTPREQHVGLGNGSACEPEKHRDQFDWGLDHLQPRKAFVMPSRSPSTLSVSSGRSMVSSVGGRCPSPEALILDHIRNAILVGNVDYVKEFANNNRGFFADTILKAGWTGLIYAAWCAKPEIVKHFLTQGANPNFAFDKVTALMAACSSTSADEASIVECIKLLINAGANLKAEDRYLNNPLIMAAKKGKAVVVKELISLGSEINKNDCHGCTALHYAAQEGFGKIVRMLLDSGADTDVLNNKGRTAADLAEEQEHKEIADIIERVRQAREDALRKLKEDEINTLEQMEKPPPAVFRYDSQATSSKLLRQQNDLEMFLSGLSMSYYVPIFQKENIGLSDLIKTTTEENLKEIGIHKLGDRKRILEEVTKLVKVKWDPKSLPSIRSKELSCPDAVYLMMNIAKHLEYIEATVSYLRNRLKRQPQVLELGQDVANVIDLSQDINECLRNSRFVFDEIKFLRADIEPVLKASNLKRPLTIGTTKFNKDIFIEELNEKELEEPKQIMPLLKQNKWKALSAVVASTGLFLAIKLLRKVDQLTLVMTIKETVK